MFACKIFKVCFGLLVAVQLVKLYEKHDHQGHAQPISVLKSRSSPGTLLSSSISTQTKLFSKTRMFLQIEQNGQVSGTLNCSSQYVQLEISSVGTGMVRIKGVKSARYLAMNSTGYLYSTITTNDETVFKNVLESSGYHTFASNKYYQTVLHDTFVAIRNNGATKNGSRTNKYQKSVQYLMITNPQC